MNRKYILFLAAFLLFINNCFGQWYIQNPLPSNETINCILFLDDNTGFVGCNFGLLMKTTNSGINWEQKSMQGSTYKIQFINNTGFAEDFNGLYISTNLGETWSLIFQTTNALDFCFINANTGYVSVFELGNKLYKTTDKGLNWNFISPLTSFGPYIYFLNENTGYLMGRSIYKTTNAGINWIPLIAENYYHDFKTYHFLNEFTGYLAGTVPGPIRSIFFKTTNGGISWDSTIFNANYSFTKLQFKNDSIGYIAGYMGSSGKVAATTNGGTNWNIQSVGNNSLQSLFFTNLNTGYVGGTNGALYKTTNSSISWTSLRYGPDATFRGIHVLDQNNAHAVGDSGIVMNTSNGGQLWTRINTINTGLNSVYFTNTNSGFISANSGKILKTTNSGVNWSTFDSGLNNNLLSIKFINDSVGFALADFNLFLKTFDRGINWSILSTNLNTLQNGMYFINKDTGFVVSSNTITKTTNGGLNWNSINLTCTSCNMNLYDIFFINNNIGYTVGQRMNLNPPSFSGIIYKTTNNGQDWILFSALQTNEIIKLQFMDINTGYALSRSSCYKTTNGGELWNLTPTLPGAPVYNMNFLNSETGYVVGSGGFICKTSNGGVFVGISVINKNIPTEISLSQNYPNPFNPTTKIKFDIPKQSFAKLTVYDILGREVAQLVNEELKPGTYSFDWDGSNYASGIYFYKLDVGDNTNISGDFIETKKMVLMK